jgi:TPR repeat protein
MDPNALSETEQNALIQVVLPIMERYNVSLETSMGDYNNQKKIFDHYNQFKHNPDAHLQYALGLLYELGFGVAQNKEAAISCYQEAMKQQSYLAARRYRELVPNADVGTINYQYNSGSTDRVPKRPLQDGGERMDERAAPKRKR